MTEKKVTELVSNIVSLDLLWLFMAICLGNKIIQILTIYTTSITIYTRIYTTELPRFTYSSSKM